MSDEQAVSKSTRSAEFLPSRAAVLLRQARKQRGLSQEDVGRMVGVSDVTVGYWETGRSRPSDANKFAVQTLFSIPFQSWVEKPSAKEAAA